MLQRLRVKNFLLINDAVLELSPHLNVLSGETGTGKSLLLDALGLALGARAKADWIGPNGDLLLVEASFQGDRSVRRLVESMGLVSEGSELILSRQVRASGPSRCFVNGQQILQRDLRRLGNQLVEIHGQRQEERFRHAEVQRDLLDLYGDLGAHRRAVRACYAAAGEVEEALSAHDAEHVALARDEEWLRFQLQEIEEIAPAEGELEDVRERVTVLKALAERSEWLHGADLAFNGPEGGILEALETLDARLPAAGESDQEHHQLQEELRALLQQARRFYRSLGSLRRDHDDELGGLPTLEQRLSKLERLQRKHRKPLEDLLEAAEEMRRGLARLAEGDLRRADLEQQRGVRLEELKQAARALTEARLKAAGELNRLVAAELKALGMPGVEVRIQLEPLPPARGDRLIGCEDVTVGPTGGDRVCFLARTNPGASPRPMGEIASGGEMARIALALRVALGKRGRSLLTVFDEIDAGLGATAAQTVAKRLTKISRHRQVLLVTHLPVIAAAADRHFQVWKRQRAKQTESGVEQLVERQRVGEIARMLSGSAKDDRARAHATGLLGGES